MMKKFCYFLMLLAMAGCGKNTSSSATNPTAKDTIPTQPYIKLTDGFSIMKNPNKEVPSYQIPNLDSFVVDIKGYEFVLPSPEFDYIRENINYNKMLGGDWAYMHIIYNDSLEIRPIKMNEIVKDEQFAITGLKNRFEKEPPSEFKLAFRFYIDNGKGQQEIDQFKVKVVNQ